MSANTSIPPTFVDDLEWEYRQLKRDGNIALFERTRRKSVQYETFIVRSTNAGEIYPFPSDYDRFTFGPREYAERKFEKLVKKRETA